MAQRGVDVGAILAEQIPPAPTPEIAPAGEDKPGGSKWLKVGDDKETPEQTTTQKADSPRRGCLGQEGQEG